MRILILAPQPFFQHRGTPISTRLLTESLAARGNQIDFLAFHEGEDIEIPNCRFFRIPAIPGIRNVPPGFSLKKVICDIVFFFCAWGKLLRNKYDLIHAVEEAAFMGVVFRFLLGIPYVYDMDSSLAQQLADKYRLARWLYPLLERAERLAVRHSQGVVAVCQALADRVRAYGYDQPVARLEDQSLLQGKSTADNQAEILKYDGPVVMYVGNLESYQGIDLLLNSQQRLLSLVPNAHLVIIGGSESTIQHYERMATRLGVERQTHFLGPRPSWMLGHFLRQADVLASPRIDGSNTPMKIYSYLDSTRPLVATRLETHTQVLDDEIALLADPTPADFAHALATLLNDPELRELLAYRARLRVEERFSAAAYDQKLNEFYDQVQSEIDAVA